MKEKTYLIMENEFCNLVSKESLIRIFLDIRDVEQSYG